MRNYRSMTGMVLLIAIAVLAGNLPAQSAKQKDRKDTAATETVVSGTVLAVDANNMRMTVQIAPGDVREFVLRYDGTIRKGRRFVNLSEVAAGDRVTIRGAGTEARCEVKNMTIHQAAASPDKTSGGELRRASATGDDR